MGGISSEARENSVEGTRQNWPRNVPGLEGARDREEATEKVVGGLFIKTQLSANSQRGL